MKTPIHLILTLLLLLSLVFSCRYESVDLYNGTQNKSSYFGKKIESALKLENFNSYYFKHHLTLDLSNYVMYESDGMTYYEYAISATNIEKYELKSMFKEIAFSIITYIDKEGVFKTYLLERCSKDSKKSLFYLGSNFNNGTLNIYSLDGEILNSIAFHEGKYIATKNENIHYEFINYEKFKPIIFAKNEPTCVPVEVVIQ